MTINNKEKRYSQLCPDWKKSGQHLLDSGVFGENWRLMELLRSAPNKKICDHGSGSFNPEIVTWTQGPFSTFFVAFLLQSIATLSNRKWEKIYPVRQRKNFPYCFFFLSIKSHFNAQHMLQHVSEQFIKRLKREKKAFTSLRNWKTTKKSFANFSICTTFPFILTEWKERRSD